MPKYSNRVAALANERLQNVAYFTWFPVFFSFQCVQFFIMLIEFYLLYIWT